MYKKEGTLSPLFFLFILCLGCLLLSGKPDLSSKGGEENPMEQREEKLKIFRGERDRFFKEDPNSPLRESHRKTFKGLLYYPIDLRYAMIGSIERYLVDPKPLYTQLPTSKGTEKKYVKYGRFKFGWMGKEYSLQIYRPWAGGTPFFLLRIRPPKPKPIPKDVISSSKQCPEGGC